MDLGAKDDCESWFYLFMDIIQSNGLPWKRIPQRDEVMRCKEDCRRGERRENLFEGLKCHKELGRIMDYIDQMRYYDKAKGLKINERRSIVQVDYSFIYEVLKVAATSSGGSLEDLYDWEKDDDCGTPAKSRSRERLHGQ